MFPAAPALTVSVAPATPTVAGRVGPHLHVRVLSGPARRKTRSPEPPPPFHPCCGEGASGMPPAARGSRALTRPDLRCRRHFCEKSAAASGHVIPLTVRKNLRAGENPRRRNA